MTILPSYPKCNAFIMDRACGFEPSARKDSELKQLKYYPVDLWHQKTHAKKRKNSPKNVARLRRRARGVNTQTCEQTRSWSRGYSKLLSSMRSNRRHFAALYFAR